MPALLLGLSAYAIAEDITLTTYYPSPRGVYQELRVGSGSYSAPTGSLHVLKSADDGNLALRVDDQAADLTPFAINQNGDVGIGTAAPTAQLHVAGTGNVAFANTGNVMVGTAVPVPSAQLQVDTTTRGFLPPRVTTAQRDAIAGPVTGLLVYNTNTSQINTFNGTVWGPAGYTGVVVVEQLCVGVDIVQRQMTFQDGILVLVADVIASPGGCTPSPPPPPPFYCVIAGTLVRMADGSLKPIEAIQVGERVLGYREAAKRLEPVAVLERLQHPAEDHPTLVVITAGDAELALTPNHRLLTGAGWKRADAVQVGEAVFVPAGESLAPARVSHVASRDTREPLHTIRTDADSYVANGVVIHTE